MKKIIILFSGLFILCGFVSSITEGNIYPKRVVVLVDRNISDESVTIMAVWIRLLVDSGVKEINIIVNDKEFKDKKIDDIKYKGDKLSEK